MFSNYLRVFIRNIRRNSFFTFLNVLGLTLGIGVSFVIVLYVTDEISFDKFHKDGNLIHRAGIHGILSGNSFEGVNTCPPLSAALSREVPGIESSIRIGSWSDQIIKKADNNEVLQEQVLVADSNFFKFFTFELLAGDRDEVLKKPQSIVLTETTAIKYFGNAGYHDIIGETLIVGNSSESYQVTGVTADPPKNSHFQFEVIISMTTWEFSHRLHWTNNGLYTYFKINPNTDIQQIDGKFDGLVEKYVGPEIQQFLGITLAEFKETGGDYGYFTQPLHDIHFSNYDGDLGANGNKQNVLIFSIVAMFVLVIAAVNFINLSTAKASDRAKEIGIRKSIGAYKNQLIYQFLLESIMLVFIAAIIAFTGIILSLDYLNVLTNKEFVIGDIINVNNILFYAGSVIIIGLLAGFYPSIVLSSFKPTEVIKGKPLATNTSRFNPRNLLVGFQFTLTTMAIILTIVISKQLNHMRTFDLGFDKEQLMVVFNARSLSNQESFKNELNNLAAVSNVSITQGYPPRISSNSVFRVGDTNEDILFHQYYTDIDHLASMGLKLKQGRFFEDHQLDENSVVLNETALKNTGWVEIDNKRILEFGDDENNLKPFNVIGVVEDFHFQDFKSEVRPLLIFCSPEGRYLTMRIEGQNIMEGVKAVEDKWAEFTGGKPFDYSFVDRQFDNLFKTEERLANLTILFSVLTIVTASLGLFGLAAFVAHSRRKEFGIRKVLGARERLIWFLQFKYFISIAIVAILIAVPLSYYLTDIWLNEFVYRITNGLSIYMMAILSIALIILISVGYQSLKASRVSPANVLRDQL